MSKFSKLIRRMMPPIMIILITAVMSIAAYRSILTSEEERCWNNLQSTADSINNEIDVRFKDNISILKLAANAMVQENRVESYEAITNHLNAFQNMTIFNRIDVIYPDNSVLLQSGDIISLSESSFDDIAAQGEHMSVRMTDFYTGKEVIYYSVPVVSNGQTLALLTGVIDCESMPSLFKATAYEGNAFVCIVDYSDGSFIMDDWHDSLGNMFDMKPRETLPGYKNVDLISDVKEAKTGVTAYKSAVNGKGSYMYYTPAGIFNWELLIVVQEQVAFASLAQLKSTLLLLGTVEAVLLLVYFIWTFIMVNQLEKSTIEIEEKRKAFEQLSYNDTLTLLYNRNKYNQVLEEFKTARPHNIGVAFFDLNCLKHVNDEQGHSAGDELLQNTAKLIVSVFPDKTFRIGGDEFVVIAKDIDEQTFCSKIEDLSKMLSDHSISVSIGEAWEDSSNDMKEIFKKADEKMYAEKRQYYEQSGSNRDRRGNRAI